MRYLEVDDLLQVLERLGARGPEIEDGGLLVSALVRPRAQLNGADVYESLALKAAALLTSLAQTSPLKTNNLRVAWVLTRLFCAANGAPLVAPDDDAVEVVRATAAGAVPLVALASQLGAWMTPSVQP